jgi:alpha-amylase/alpha-mannosidase (GH57 family)
MADVLIRYPNVHVTAALSPTLLWQVQEIYVKRMEPFIKESKNPRKLAKIDANGFLARMKGKTDPWIDICLTPAERLTDQDKAYLYKNPWNAFTISAVRMNRFPELVRLYEKWRDARGNPSYTVQELRTLKFFGIFAHFDTEFFERNVPLLQSGTRIKRALDLRDLISYRSDGKYYLKHDVTEEDCQRIVASAYCIMASILPAFDKVKYSPVSRMGQMELAVTSYSDAVLPLLINSDIARQADPSVDLPAAYKHPQDADAQLRLAIAANQRYFNVTPTGYVPPYGAMSADVVPLLKKYNLSWFASDQAVLARSEPAGASALAPQKVSVGDASVFGVFSHTLLSNRINWTYRNYYAENSADDFVQTLLTFAPQNGKDDVMITVVIDNDDAWQGYERDTDGKGFVNSLYRKLDALYPQRNLISATLTEYIAGNRDRGIPPHAADGFPSLTALGAGSRFDGDFRMWIGGPQTNAAWTQLGVVRAALPDPPDVIPAPESYDILLTDPLAIFYGATSEHWFQTFSAASVLYSDPKPYERAFHALLANALDKAGAAPTEQTSFIPENSVTPVWEKPKKLVHCTFRVKLVDREAITHVYIAGSRKDLGNLEPNTVPMWDNGENGDEVFGNNVWTIVTDIEEGDLLYKYSNSGGQGTWEGSEAFPDVWRKVRIEGDKMEFDDIFTKLKK